MFKKYERSLNHTIVPKCLILDKLLPSFITFKSVDSSKVEEDLDFMVSYRANKSRNI